ncbi:uncharacterized protein SPPG_03423 [Spizellomyces punctatus DAOM BR117]|uniref:Uncharacterized protein n=1 Tax=Spizellomyces punctatus (strain DAOM BR117) TaxID=645134 RepID=A0A0L0HKS4_SPIPD|nr:uncharacterized protein SPPG_03423 [Spizellomyces punctatus DAOM BR117]KND01628.1 hypothetical protein SPPG_03423 [Spizellomyces punctatus DAOM BR117]|eukprot:XP_016609667.1 hypothetical protein SPPG_03423 [Spizellomyces punctatus DAOM BR117]
MTTPTYTYPAFQIRYPLGKGFPTSGVRKSQSPTRRPRSSPSTLPREKPEREKERSAVENEYIKNLQQQVYLLELETRYLRSGRSKSGNEDTSFPFQGTDATSACLNGGVPTAPLNTVIKDLKNKYVELQEGYKRQVEKLQETITNLQKQNHTTTLTTESLTQTRDQLLQDLQTLQTNHNTEKDGLYKTIHTLKQDHENLKAEMRRLEISYERCREEKEEGVKEVVGFKMEVERLRGQVEEQVQVHDKLQKKVEELSRDKAFLQAQLETTPPPPPQIPPETLQSLKTQLLTSQTQHQQTETLRLKLQTDCSNLIKLNTELTMEIESLRDELGRERRARGHTGRMEWVKETANVRQEVEDLRDQIGMLKIKIQVGENQKGELVEKLKATETSLSKTLESRTTLSERVQSLQDRLHAQTLDIVSLNQDKSILIDDLATLKNTHTLLQSKYDSLLQKNHSLTVELEAHKQQHADKQKLAKLLKEVEYSGESYLGLMKGVRQVLDKCQKDEQGDADVE